jgi:radical SAM superfamily enzyme YgiQ (UPF0313 family)
MKICLVFPRTLKEFYGLSPPLGITLLGTILKNKGYNVKLIDSSFDNNLKKTKKEIKSFKPDVVGISILSSLYNNAKELISFSKKIGCITIIGGPHASILPKQNIEENKDLDFVVIGEGEETLPELLEAIQGKKRLKQVNGICFRNNGNIIFTKPRLPLQNLNLLPFPNMDLLNTSKEYLKSGIINLISFRGCPYNCSFCQPTLRKVFGSKIRAPNPSYIVNEIEFFYNKYNIRDFCFVDDIFTINKKWLIDFENNLKESNLKGRIRFIVNSRINLFDEGLAEILFNLNCHYVFFGVESGSQKILNNLRKSIKIKQIKRAFALCKKYKIKTHAFFMLGSPGETRVTLKMTEKLINEIEPNTLYLFTTTPLLGTDLYKKCKRKGILNLKSYAHLDYRGFFEKDLPIKLENINYDDIIAFKNKILKRRRFKFLLSNLIDVVNDMIHEKSLKKAIFKWRFYKRMQVCFG